MKINEEELKDRVANNLINYRKISKLTQLELAEKINYSDKSISKWERKEGLPDITILVKLADLYGITVNDFLAQEPKIITPKKHVSQLLVTLMAFTGVWVLAFLIYMLLGLIDVQGFKPGLVFIYAIPLSVTILVIFSYLWGTMMMKFISTSLFLWSMALSVYLTFSTVHLWLLFITAVPVQIIIIFWFILKNNNKL
ncbi:MAG: helix-turn-helix transcriptional regulator [Candidatus Izemoplasmatales bacterium]|jgi:transcriptional regulator with XRE-family HTH domain|nr:helix-turn-helix transcriptional regulator [Candidatus Izemoplasmatales bacterium]